MNEMDRRRSNAFERHAQTALTLIMVALILWVGSATQATQIKVAELTVQVNNLQSVINAPEARVNDLTRRIEVLEALHWENKRD